jgi:hypothetical protein
MEKTLQEILAELLNVRVKGLLAFPLPAFGAKLDQYVVECRQHFVS